jgi:23S rRNA pseudouridine1911/1915/1917 synthase
VTLDTGRTHQIRVHLSAISAPLVGDHTYGGDTAGNPQLNRVWLHACLLSFESPDGGDDVIVSSSLPDELRSSLDALGDSSLGEVPSGL